MRRQIKSRSKLNRRVAAGYGCEVMETRRLLTGTWTSITNAIPAGDSAQNAIVLSDGSVMVHGGSDASSPAWYKLTPVNGNYTVGNWSTLASNTLGRLFFASDMLTSGNVMVLGGEYTGPSTTGTDTNTGEIYNPLTNSWSPMANFPQGNCGDAPSEILPNGNVLVGDIFNTLCYIYNPSTNTWASTGSKLHGDASGEESWVKLPDDSILSYDVSASVNSGTPQAQRYIPSTGTWVDAGTPPSELSATSVGYELGAGVLLPDGRVLFLGATGGRTTYYTPSTNSWAVGPTMPNSWVAADAPAAVLPNGNVLMALSPEGGLNAKGNYSFPGPEKVYELNTSTNVFTDVTPSVSGFGLGGSTFASTFVMLPSGQVLMFDDGTKIAIYTPSGSANSAWAPSISNITNDQGTNVFTLTGYQLNGISEGAAYGDDNQMSSNYPIVRLQDQFGNISFARTFNWTNTGVASSSSSVNFTEPGGLGAYLVTVIANGIASLPVLDIQCSVASGENFTVQPNSNSNYADIALSPGGGAVATFYIGAFNELIMTGDAASNTLVINDNLFGRQTIINGGDGNDFLRVETDGAGTISEYGGNGNDYFDFSFYARNLSNDTGFTYVYGGAGTDSVFVYDNNYASATTYTVDSAEVNRPGFGGFYYDAGVEGVTLNTGSSSSNVVNITSTYYLTPFFLFGNAALAVNIGSGGSAQGIAAAVYLDDAPSFMIINVDDSADATSRTATLSTYTPSGDSPWGSLSGLTGGSINFEYADTSSFSFATGTGTTNVVNVLATGVATYINGGGGTRTVNIGNPTQGVQGINGTLVLNASSGSETVNIDDSADSNFRTTTLDNTVVNGYTSERIAGLSPLPIEYYLSGTTALSIKTSGTDGNITNILTLSTPTAIIGECDSRQNDILNIGNAGSLAGVTGALTVTNPTGYTDITLSDYTDTYSVTYTFSSFIQSGVPWGKLVFPTYTLFGTLTLYNTITYTRNDISSLTVNVGSSTTAAVQDTAVPTIINEGSGGSNASSVSLVANVLATTASLTINTTNDIWTVNAGNAGSVQGLLGAVAVTSSGFGSSGSVVVDDSADAVSRTVTISDSQIVGLAPAIISYPNFRSQFNVSGGTGGNHLTVTTTPVGGLYPTNVLNSGNGSDTILVDATQASLSTGTLIVNTGNGTDSVTVGNGSLSTFNSPVTVNGGAGTDSLLLGDQGVAANDTYTVTPTTVARPNFSLTYSGLEALDLEAETGNNVVNVNNTAVGTPVYINANNGTDTINVNQTDPTAPVTIKPSTGNDAVNVDTVATPGATAIFAASQQIGILTIGNKGTAVEAAGSKLLLQANAVNTSGTGTLDMTSNDLVIHGGSLAGTTSQIGQGFNGGNWLGSGITSSSAATDPSHLTALGVILNNDGSGNTIYGVGATLGLFDGANPGLTDILVRYTYYGDANLNGSVNSVDYAKIDNGYLGHLTGWANGDFNYDSKVNGTDYTLIDNAFNNQGAALAALIATPAPKSSGVKTVTPSAPVTTRSVSGTLFANGNSGKGLAGWTVYADLNHDGKFDKGDIATVTDSKGRYRFSSLPIGKYAIRSQRPSGARG